MAKGQGKPTGLTHKQKAYIKNVVSHKMTKTKAAMEAGYSPGTSSGLIEKSGTVKNAMLQAMERAGVTEELLALKIKDGLEAMEKRFYSHEGRVIDKRETEDHNVRHKFLQTSLELHKYIKSNTIDTLNLGVVVMPSKLSSDEWNRGQESPTLNNHVESNPIVNDKLQADTSTEGDSK